MILDISITQRYSVKWTFLRGIGKVYMILIISVEMTMLKVKKNYSKTLKYVLFLMLLNHISLYFCHSLLMPGTPIHFFGSLSRYCLPFKRENHELSEFDYTQSKLQMLLQIKFLSFGEEVSPMFRPSDFWKQTLRRSLGCKK